MTAHIIVIKVHHSFPQNIFTTSIINFTQGRHITTYVINILSIYCMIHEVNGILMIKQADFEEMYK